MSDDEAPIVIRDGLANDLPRILALLKQAKSTVGFLSDTAVAERIGKGTLFVAASGDGIVGYLLFDLVAESVAVRQLAVDRSARNLGVAKGLVDELVRRFQDSRRGIRLWCRRDYEANEVWHRLGFSPRNERGGRGKEVTVLTLWWRTFGQPDLFTFARDEDDRPLAALDTNLLIRGADHDPEVVENLLADWVRAEVAFEVVDHSLVEINRHGDAEVRKRHVQYASCLDNVRYPPEVAESLQEAAIAVLGDAAKPHEDDILIAARAAAGGAEWFVTEDVAFRRACRDVLGEIADIEVVSLAEMLIAADRLARDETYHGQFLQGTEVEVREVESGDLDALAATFLNQKAGETYRSWRKRLGTIAADVANTQVRVFSDASGPLALAAMTSGEVMSVPVCRVRRGPAEPTLARQLLGWLRDQCTASSSLAVEIADPNPGRWIEDRLTSEGYFSGPSPTAVPISGIVTFNQIADVLSTSPFGSASFAEQANGIRKLELTAAAAHSLESAFHPAIVMDAGLPTVRMPIKPAYAAELFDHVLSEGQLFRRDRSIALRREHVFFRTPTVPALLQAPTRLLWQVTGSKKRGGGYLRARSLLNETVIGQVDQLIHRFSHLGVLNRDEISSLAKEGEVMALRFSHTKVFPKPVSLADYRLIMDELEPGKGLAHAGPQPVTEQVFLRLARLAE